ncbi:Hypothetical predicted protein [Octopus vulgaris]|uniref:Uncharacterized protein n=1 Tax=Octopus vulgaris TaxID=6645 RepID=A0AA36BIJ6_OCTVU|nr:Hypothetical predicted protein [Octopus vulgaris]
MPRRENLSEDQISKSACVCDCLVYGNIFVGVGLLVGLDVHCNVCCGLCGVDEVFYDDCRVGVETTKVFSLQIFQLL